MTARPSPLWHGFARRGAYTVVACLAVALLLTAMQPRHFGLHLLYSLIIGPLCWLAVDGGRLLAARRVARRDPQDVAAREGWPGWGWMAAVIVVGVSVAYTAGLAVADSIAGIAPSTDGVGAWRRFAFPLLLSLVASVAVTGTFHLRERIAAMRAEAEAARRAAAESQLRLLQSQLEPHMLFNTLANLRVLIGTDPPRAQAMLDRLIAFLRATLGASRRTAHPLEAEFARIADYLALMQVRMGPRLLVRLDLPDELKAVEVPTLLLQPLVENAVLHGLEPKLGGGRLEVVARRDGERLRLSVRDTGVGPGVSPAGDGTRFGLAQVRERLAALHADRAGLRLEPATDAEGGTVACIEMPWPAAAPATAPAARPADQARA